jgi:glutamate synthase (NADPH/NADH) small chain
MGVEFRLGVEIGRDIGLEQLAGRSTTRCSSAWAPIAHEGRLPRRGPCRACIDALPYLISNVNRLQRADGAGWDPPRDSSTCKASGWWCWAAATPAMDCNAHRHPPGRGQRHLRLPPRRGQHARLAREVKNAKEEGVHFLFNRQPIEIVGDERVEGVKVCETRLGAPDARAAAAPEVVPGSEEIIPADG